MVICGYTRFTLYTVKGGDGYGTQNGKTDNQTVQPNDAGDLFEYLSNPEVALYEPYDTFTLEECRAEAARRSKDSSFWAVCLKDANKLIGNIYLAERDFDTWELGFVFNPKYQGKGYAAESASAVVDHAVNSLNARRIIAMCNPQNTRSWRLLERLGFRREGHLRQNIFFKTGADGKPIWLDTYEYGLLASEWRRPAGNHADKTEIAYLADHPEHIHTCASWAFGLWGVSQANHLTIFSKDFPQAQTSEASIHNRPV